MKCEASIEDCYVDTDPDNCGGCCCIGCLLVVIAFLVFVIVVGTIPVFLFR